MDLRDTASYDRPVNTFTVPSYLDLEIKTVGLVELTAQEEMLAGKKSKGAGIEKLGHELMKLSLVEIDGEKISRADGSDEKIWNRLSPQARELVATAFSSLHRLPDEAAPDFLKSRQVRVGG